jgi:putative transposase
MKRSKFSEEQIVYALHQADAGTPVSGLCRQLGVSNATFYAWKKRHGHAYLGMSELRRLRQLEEETSGRRPCEKKSKAGLPLGIGPVVSGNPLGEVRVGGVPAC